MIIYRNVTADSVVVDEKGYPQLTDMRYATKAEPAPTDFCGYPHYLSPEQVSGQGHGLPTDYWDLGIFTYEMITGGANPWLTGDPAKDSEVGLYSRISGHKHGQLAFPEGVNPSPALTSLLNDLIHPNADDRLSVFSRFCDHSWFAEAQLNFNAIKAGDTRAPLQKEVQALLQKVTKASVRLTADKFTGDNKQFAAFSLSVSDLSA